MDHSILVSPGLTVALALLAGVAAQALSQHLRLPGIVLLLAVGMALGPDGAGWVQPALLGGGLNTLVGFAVAVILFEGGMNLNLARLRREQRPIRRLITYGAVITALGAGGLAWAVLGWDWRLALLFGALMIVTGPTVVTPLLRRLKMEHTSATVLEAEGLLGDAVGAIVATIALEVAIGQASLAPGRALAAVALHLGFGTLLGVAAGLGLSALLRARRIVPEGLANVLTLAVVVTLFQGANALLDESGIAAVVVAGITVGNRDTLVVRELMEFKEQLTAMLIGMLFVLLAADVRLAEVRALGWRGVVVVIALMVLVRPLNVAVSAAGTALTARQRIFVGWIAPRGIVAAAVSSLAAVRLEAHGIAGGEAFRALVFLVIAVTVLSAGLTGGFVAGVLGLRRPQGVGWVILGAHELARSLARALQTEEHEVVCVDTNAVACQSAEREGLRVLFANGLEERTLLRAGIDTRAGAIALTPNDEVNVLFLQRAKQVGRLTRLYAAVGPEHAATLKVLHESGGQALFGHAVDIEPWLRLLRKGGTAWSRYRLGDPTPGENPMSFPSTLLALALYRNGTPQPMGEQTKAQKGDEIICIVPAEARNSVLLWMADRGWSVVEPVLTPQA
jgi:NhaP-type Na+/H+ or K+/H+ antiporter